MTNIQQPIDYLVIGHVTRDVAGTDPISGEVQYNPGGTVTYSGRLAQALDCRTAVLTSARPDYDLAAFMPGMDIVCIPSEDDTIFDNIYHDNSRIQILHSVAAPITPADLPAAWRDIPIVHLGPLTNEVEPEIIDCFPDSIVGLTPQGWMRRWGEDGRVYATSFPAEEMLLRKAAAVVISEEDLLDDGMLQRYIDWSDILVMTQNYAGCTVFTKEVQYQIPAPEIELVEPTGAGDIFAAAFFVQLGRNGRNPLEAAEFANHVAAHSVTQVTLADKERAWREHEYRPIHL